MGIHEPRRYSTESTELVRNHGGLRLISWKKNVKIRRKRRKLEGGNETLIPDFTTERDRISIGTRFGEAKSSYSLSKSSTRIFSPCINMLYIVHWVWHAAYAHVIDWLCRTSCYYVCSVIEVKRHIFQKKPWSIKIQTNWTLSVTKTARSRASV